MGLKNEILAEQATATEGTMEKLFTDLSKEEAEDLKELLTDSSIMGTSIHRVLKARGFSISERTIQRYRRDLT